MKFWPSGRRRDPVGSLLDLIFHSPGNRSVFRYSEIQGALIKMNKKDTRRLIDDLPEPELPELIETDDKLLSIPNVTGTTKTISNKKTTSEKVVSRRMRSYKKHYANKGKYPSKRKHRTKAKNYMTFSPVRYTKTSRVTFDDLKFWVRDPRFEKKWLTAQNRGTKPRSFSSENYLNKNGLRDSNEIKGSFNTLRSDNSNSRESWNVHSLEQNSIIRCRPSAESFEKCYSHYQARHRRIPQMMRAIAPSTDVKDTNISMPVVRATKMVEVKRSGAEEQEEKKKEEKLLEDLNPYGIYQLINEMNCDVCNTKLIQPITTLLNVDIHSNSRSSNFGHFTDFLILQQINEKLIPAHTINANMTVEVLGRTLEHKDIVMIKATALPKNSFRAHEDKYDKSMPDKKIVLIVHGLAAMGLRDVPCLSTIEGFQKLMSYYYEHLDQFDIFIIPMANPDGAAQWMNRIWNKNASPQSACPGVAVDRNFDVAFKESQHAVSSCQQQYPGPEPFSEPESRAVRDVLHKYSDRIIGYFHVHASSYKAEIFKGDAALYPKGYTDFASDDDKYVDLKAEIDDMMKNASFKVYSFTTDTLYNWYGKVSGTSVDYAASVYGIPFSMELVMQLYSDNMFMEESAERESSIVLTEVWHRVIDVIFKFMYKSINNAEKK